MKKQPRSSNHKQHTLQESASRKVRAAADDACLQRHLTCFEAVPALTAQRLQRLIEQHLQELLNAP